MEKFNDLKTNVVYFSEFFAMRFPEVFKPSKVNLEANGIKVKLIKGNQNIWCRDYMPIQVNDHFVRFGYKGYGTGYEEYPWLIIPEKCFDICKPLTECNHIVDGGGIIRNDKYAIITNKIFKDNPDIGKESLIKLIQELIGLDLIIIGMEPDDTLGHADGICKFINDDTILINDYSPMFHIDKRWETYSNELIHTIENAGLKTRLMPYSFDLCPHYEDKEFYEKYPFADDNNPGYGYYINFLLTKTCILAPVFGIPKDQDAIAKLKECYPNHSVVAIDCKELSMEGGLSNCTTWNIIEE